MAVVRLDSTSINVSWTPVPIELAAGIILQYSVVYQTEDGSSTGTVLVSSLFSYAVINGLMPGSLYGATVAGITIAGEGLRSPVVYEKGL